MGLDIYLYKRNPNTPLVAPPCGDDDEETDFESGEQIEINSSKYPEHMFKIGYFRSSYNDGGIDNKLRSRIKSSLADIFGNDGRKYHVVPDWKASAERAVKAIADIKAQVAEAGAFEVVDVSQHDAGPSSREDAMALFQREREGWAKHPSGFNSYSSGAGMFWRNGYKVYAIIPGESEDILAKVMGRKVMRPTTYVVYGPEAEADPLAWYIQALEIVIETCEYVLAQDDVQRYVLHWSG